MMGAGLKLSAVDHIKPNQVRLVFYPGEFEDIAAWKKAKADNPATGSLSQFRAVSRHAPPGQGTIYVEVGGNVVDRIDARGGPPITLNDGDQQGVSSGHGRTATILALIVAGSCTRATERHDQSPPAPPVTAKETPATATQPAATVPTDGAVPTRTAAPRLPAADDPSCTRPLGGLAAIVYQMESAEEGMSVYPEAVASWKAIAAPCRGARWYFLGARILRYVSNPLQAGSTTSTDPQKALAIALTGAPDAEIYAFVAFTSALGEAPKLPAGACSKLLVTLGDHPSPDDANRMGYVCSQEALARGDGAEAMRRFAWVSPRIFPDLELRKAEALAAQGKQAEARAAARAVHLDPVLSRSFGATDAEYQQLVAARKALAAEK